MAEVSQDQVAEVSLELRRDLSLEKSPKLVIIFINCVRIINGSLNRVVYGAGFISDFLIFKMRMEHTENYFQNFIESNRNQIVFTIFRQIWNQTDVRLAANQSENGKYNLISV